MRTKANGNATEPTTNDVLLAIMARLDRLEGEPKQAEPKPAAKPTKQPKPADPPVFDFKRTANGNISLKISNARSKYNFLVLAPEIWAELADRLPRVLANEDSLPVYGK